ncbi:MAG: hypothetical protein IJD21_05860 [Oscillospiraceae bacterium]|nr:hypothetical protein [Oscillospiraceae bacterium]
MSVELIVMLTWHDVTVPNAKEIFLECKDAPAKHWGFKIEGTTPESMRDLICCMKEHGKTVYIEVLAMDEETSLKAAQICVETGVDHVLGTVYNEKVAKLLEENGIGYSPFAALSPDSRLRGSVESIVERAKADVAKNTSGITTSAFRYVDGDPIELLKALDPAMEKPFRLAGSVNTFERIDFLKTLPNLAAFTIGGAFFEGKFGGTFAEQITKVCEYLKK